MNDAVVILDDGPQQWRDGDGVVDDARTTVEDRNCSPKLS